MNQPHLPLKRVNPVELSRNSLPVRKMNFVRSSWDLFALLLLAGFLAVLMYLGGTVLPGFLPALRLGFGLIFVLFAPGYAVQAALFPHPTDQERVARLALSIGSSVALLPPLALILDRLPWGLHPWPILLSLIIVQFIFSGIAIIRRLRLPVQVGSAPGLNIHLKGWWSAQDISDRRLLVLVGIGFGIALLSAVAIMILPKPGDRFTEFYMLGQFGLAQDYPREAIAGRPISVTIGITNQERVASVYHLQVKLGDQVLTQVGPLALDTGQTWEQALEFVIPSAGENQQILFVLGRDGQPSPYRTLQLRINVRSAEAP
jgi:uncharacterized membrane protein